MQEQNLSLYNRLAILFRLKLAKVLVQGFILIRSLPFTYNVLSRPLYTNRFLFVNTNQEIQSKLTNC